MNSKVKFYAKHFIISVSLLCGIIFVYFWVALPIITRHGEAIMIPDFCGKSIEECSKIGVNQSFNLKFLQTAVYKIDFPKDCVILQHPRPGSSVKKGRTIYLTLNTQIIKDVLVPNLVGCTIRNAYTVLKNHSLTFGKIDYVQDIAHNCVLEQSYNGDKIFPGKSILAGSEIDLLVGMNPYKHRVLVPSIPKDSLENIEIFLIINHLRLGTVTYKFSDKHTPGTLISTKPVSGSEVSISTAIDLEIANESSYKLDAKL